MKIGGLQKSSLLDFPGKIAAIIFTQGCNFRCTYCHNPELLPANGGISPMEFLDFLKTRRGKLDGVVISGGEPCLQKDLMDFVRQIKNMGFLMKLDTNGTFPNVIKEILAQNLVDYIAMDIKAPLEKYSAVACAKISPEKIQKSIELIKNSGLDYEFRTTVVKSQLTIDDFEKIGEMISGAKRYYLQKFLASKNLNAELKTYSDEEFELIAQKLQNHIQEIRIR